MRGWRVHSGVVVLKLELKRTRFLTRATIGELFVDGVFLCYTLEDVVREQPGVPVEEWKIPGETAIPVGDYRVAITWSNRFARMLPQLMDVPGFTGIRIHPGNASNDTEGCILVGRSVIGDTLAESRAVFMPLLDAIANAKGEVRIEVSGPILESAVA